MSASFKSFSQYARSSSSLLAGLTLELSLAGIPNLGVNTFTELAFGLRKKQIPVRLRK